MATEYKIIKIRRGIEDNFIPSNLLPGELHITTDSGKVHFCYSAGNVKQLATIAQLQELLNVSPEAYLALQQLIADLEDETVLTGILNDIERVESQLAQIAYQKAPQTEVDDIQMQVHELVLNAGNPEASSAEINQARVNALGKSYDTLKAHLNDIENGKSLNEKSINLSKLESFAREGLFITDPLSIVKGSAVQWYDGTFASSSTYDRTDFIPVKAGYLFGSKYNYHIAFYDANKTYKSGLSGDSYTFPVTVPQGAHYAIINVDKSQTDYWYRLSGNLDHYLDKSFLNIDLFPDNSTEKKDIIFKDLKIIKNSLGILDEIFSFVGNMNKYNPAEEEVGYYYQWSNGVKTSDVAYKSSGLIPVKEGEKVACSKRYHITYWSYNNTYLSGIAGGWTGYLTIPKDAYYMRATFNATDTECYITNDIANPRYFTYGTLGYIFKDNLGDKFKLFNKENIGQRSNLYGKKVNLLGDSITSINYTLPTWWQNITSKTGAVFNNYGISGTTLAHTDDRHLWDFNFGRLDAATIGYVASNPATWSTGNCFCERYDNMDTTADGVVAMGGTNDGSVPLGTWSSTDTSTFYGALNVLITGLLNIYAGKPILFCTPIQSNTAYQTNVIDPFDVLKNTLSTATMTLQIRAEAIKAKCKQYGVDCLDLYNLSGINGADTNKIYYRSGDTLHPSSYGQERIEALVCAELERMFVKSI